MFPEQFQSHFQIHLNHDHCVPNAGEMEDDIKAIIKCFDVYTKQIVLPVTY